MDILAQPENSNADLTRGEQLGIMFWVTLLLFGLVFFELKWLYHPHHGFPGGFYWPELAVLLASASLAFEPVFGVLVAPIPLLILGRRRRQAPSSDRHLGLADMFAWVRLHLGGWIVIATVVGNMYAIMELVAKTGQGLESPFAPLLAGPPLFGAFAAQSSRFNLAALVLGCSTAVLVIDRLAPAPGTQLDARFHRLHPSVPWPSWGAYAATTISLLLVAGGIAVFRTRGVDDASLDNA